MELKIYTSEDIAKYIRRRKGEKKYGQYVRYADETSEDLSVQLQQSAADYVLLGIPEDIDIRANGGKEAPFSVWDVTLDALLNTRHNAFNKGNKLYVLGHLDMTAELSAANNLDMNTKEDLKKAGKLVEEIDREVTHIISKIVAAGKKPIVIGGGQNNAYGLIKGCALALAKPLNAVNVNVFSGFGKRGKRHSENSFSYAFSEGFLRKYYIFGLYENHTSKALFKKLGKHNEYIRYATFEEITIRQKRSFAYYLNQAQAWIYKNPFGIEINCNAVDGISSGGFTPNQARSFVSFISGHANAQYLHICEATSNPEHEMQMQQTGKFIADLITDFTKRSI